MVNRWLPSGHLPLSLPCSLSLFSVFSLFVLLILSPWHRTTKPTHVIQPISKDAHHAGFSSNASIEWGVGACGHRFSTVVERRSPTIFHGRARYQQVHLDLIIKMVASVLDKSVRIISTLFCAETTNFVNWSESNGALFWGNDLKSILVTKNSFQRYIICMFEVVCKKLYFSRQLVKLTIWLCLVLRVGPTETQN